MEDRPGKADQPEGADRPRSVDRPGEVRTPGGATPRRAAHAPAPLTIRGAQEAVDAWIGQFKEGYWPPLANLTRLIEEVGELARELNHRYGPKKKRPDEPEQDLALELADVLFVIITIANEQGIDLEDALLRVLEKYRTRDSDRWER